jgi:predicted HAD superfamily Cof-like phosphohydrolase
MAKVWCRDGGRLDNFHRFLRQLWFELRTQVQKEGASLREDLRAEEIVQSEIAAEFDEEGPVVAETREKFREAKEGLDKLLTVLAVQRSDTAGTERSYARSLPRHRR